MRAGIVINPIAGGRAGDRDGSARVALARDVARRAGVEAAIRVTTRAGDAAAFATAFAAEGRDVVIAWGGDGTINEAAGPLIGSSVAIGIVPAGSGNGLARGLGVPRDPRAALAAAFGPARSAIDVGYLGDRHFLNIAGIGFDAMVAQVFSRDSRRGLITYVRTALAGVWRFAPDRYEIDLDAEHFSGPRFVAAFANGRQYGNGLVLAPQASLTDGRLDAVILAGGPAWRQMWRARRLFVRPLAPAEGVTRRSVARARVTGDRLLCHVDGEWFEAAGTLEVRVATLALRVAAATP